MTDQIPPGEGENAAAEAEANAQEEAEAKAAAEAEAKAKADEAAQAAGFADAATQAAFAAKAATVKPKRAASKAKSRGFGVKAPSKEQYEQLCALAATGGRAQLVLADGRKPIDGFAPVTVSLRLKRGRPTNAVLAGFTGADLSQPVTVTHVFALEEGDKPTASPLSIAELAAPVTLREGEQFKIGAEGVSFFAPPARD